MITVLNKKTNEIIGFDDATSKEEISTAMRGYNYGEVAPHKDTFYEKNIRPALEKSGMNIFQPKFVLDKKEPEAIRAFTTSAVRDATFGVIQDSGLQKKYTEEEQKKFPIASFLGSLVGQTGSIFASAGVGTLIKAPKIAAWAGNTFNRIGGGLLAKVSPNFASAQAGAAALATTKKIAAGALEQAKVGAIYGGIRESVTQLNAEDPNLSKIGEVMLKDSAAFALYGGVGAGIKSKAVGTATIAGLGYTLSKADGASEEDAILNGGVMGMFHLVSFHAQSPKERAAVLNDLEDMMWGYLKAKSPNMSPSVAGKAANEIKLQAVKEVVAENPQIASAVVMTSDGKKAEGVSHEAALNKIGMSKKTAVENVDYSPLFKMTDGTEITRKESIEKGLTKTGHSHEVPALKKAQTTLEDIYALEHKKSAESMMGGKKDDSSGRYLKGKAMERSAVLRKLRGEPTGNEIKLEIDRLGKLREGQEVTTVDGKGVVTRPPAYGKVKVKVGDIEKSYDVGYVESKKFTKEDAINSLKKQAEEEAKEFLNVRGIKYEPNVRQIDNIVESKELSEKAVEKIADKVFDEGDINKAIAEQGQVESKISEMEKSGAITKEESRSIQKSVEEEARIAEQGKEVASGEVVKSRLQEGVKATGELKESTAFKKAKEKYESELKDVEKVEYSTIEIADQMARAFDFLDKEPVSAKRVSLGIESAPEGIKETAISIAYAEKLLESGDIQGAADALKSRSLRQTARGQEIVLERAASTNVNDAVHFAKQVLDARMENAGRKTYEISKEQKTKTSKRRVMDKVEKEANRARKFLQDKELDIKEAQSIIDGLLCK